MYAWVIKAGSSSNGDQQEIRNLGIIKWLIVVDFKGA